MNDNKDMTGEIQATEIVNVLLPLFHKTAQFY